MQSRRNRTGPLPADALMAHRGWPAHYPENSLAGVQAALEAGAQLVEFDVQLTADGVPVVIHDEGLHRTSGREGSVLDLIASALPGIDVSEALRFGGRHGETPLPTLTAMLQLLQEYPHATGFIELKRASMRHFGREAMVDRVMREVGRHRQRVVISSDADMASMARAAGAMRIGWVTDSLDARHERAARELMPEFMFCNARRVPSDPEPFWTGSWRWVIYHVNELALAHQLLDRGADIIETDRIGEFLGVAPDAP